MSKNKIGANARSKSEEEAAYTAIGIAKSPEGKYLIVQLKISGMEVLDRKVLSSADNHAEAIHEYRIATGTFGMRYVNEMSGG